MTILSKYILREFIKTLVYSLAVAVTLFTVIELFQRLDTFIEHQARILAIVKYIAYLTPGTVILLCPIAVLLSSFITIGLLSRNFEIMALRAGGVSLNRVVIPILVCSFCISIASVLVSELMVPYSNRKAKKIYREIKGQTYLRPIVSLNQIWYRGERVIYNVRLFHYRKDVLEGITLYFFDENFHLAKRIDAETAQWTENQWVFSDVTTRTFTSGDQTGTNYERSRVIPLQETPETFKQEVRKPKEMSFRELKEYIEKTTREGYDTTQYLADLYAKTSSPFINFIIALFGIPFAIRIGRHGGFALGVTFSFAVGFTYWVFFNISLALGYSGALPPIISAWIANMIFASLGVWSLLQIEH